MKRILLVLISIAFAVSCFAQSNFTFNENDWLGVWKGKLQIINGAKKSEVGMTLAITKTDSPQRYGWKTTYGEDASKMEKNYFIYPKDMEKGQWILDEDNTILLDTYFADNEFVSFFETQNILLSSRYELKDGVIYFEVLSAQKEKQSKSGTGKEEVISYPIYALQKAELKKE